MQGNDAALADEIERARAIGLRMLGVRQRTVAELTAGLIGRGIVPEAADAVVRRFLEVGILDDWAYSREWARARHENRGLAARSIRAELRGKGVASECVEAALLPIAQTQEDVARALLARSARRLERVSPQVRVRRLASALARKGYDADLVRRLVREHEESRGVELEEVVEDSVRPARTSSGT